MYFYRYLKTCLNFKKLVFLSHLTLKKKHFQMKILLFFFFIDLLKLKNSYINFIFIFTISLFFHFLNISISGRWVLNCVVVWTFWRLKRVKVKAFFFVHLLPIGHTYMRGFSYFFMPFKKIIVPSTIYIGKK